MVAQPTRVANCHEPIVINPLVHHHLPLYTKSPLWSDDAYKELLGGREKLDQEGGAKEKK